MISGARSLYAIHQWGRCQDADTVRACADPMTSHTHPKTPAVSGLHRAFSALDVDAFESAIAQWAQQALAASGPAPAATAVAGKALRGLHGTELPGVRFVAGSAPGCGLVAGQRGGSPGQSELTAARELLSVAGNLIAGDALCCRQDYCQQLLDAGGDYPVIVKRNQRELYAAIALAFATAVPDGSCHQAQTRQRRGCRWETRRLCTANALNEYLDWPGVGPALRVERQARPSGKETAADAVRAGLPV